MVFARWSLVALSGARAAGVVRPVVAMSVFSAAGALWTTRSKEIPYAELPGLPQSFALEAGKNALAGTTPVKSADGYAIATFAAGCFWGVELEFQRLPGVVALASATCRATSEADLRGAPSGTSGSATTAGPSTGRASTTTSAQLDVARKSLVDAQKKFASPIQTESSPSRRLLAQGGACAPRAGGRCSSPSPRPKGDTTPIRATVTG
ncbi:peptide-methionine (S)-S-oxide reductase [Aureococcus anophagefferens]|nr:peptide-methionine (S)-S-oxide reductase [Aureococcus anophagefferens]